jgi:hypothetical protein
VAPEIKSALGKLYALCAMYQDMDFFLRPIIEDLEKHVGSSQRCGVSIPADPRVGLQGVEVIDAEECGGESA